MSKCYKTKPIHNSLQRAFQQQHKRNQRTNGSRDLTMTMTNKQNKQPNVMYQM